MSRSRYWLMALAAPAASVPATSVQTVTRSQSIGWMPGTSRVARTIAGTVVTRRSSMIRGFVSATYARIVSPVECRRPATSVASTAPPVPPVVAPDTGTTSARAT
jgi:hypothetical protein